METPASAAPGGASRILYITHAAPAPARLGPARRHFHLLDQLSRFYDVRLVSLADEGEADACARHFAGRVTDLSFVPRRGARRWRHLRKLSRSLNGRCDFLPALEPRLRRACERIASENVDAVILSSVLLRSLPLPLHAPIVADTHNVEFDVLRRTAAAADRWFVRHYARWQWPATWQAERHGARAVDLLLATSDRDRQVFEQEFGVEHTAVVPNGIDLDEFTPSGEPPAADTILFSGLLSYYPNQHAIRWFLAEVLPLIRARRPAARLIVVGAHPPRWLSTLRDPHVTVTGLVPDVRPYIERAAVVVAPLWIGGGTRVKILEALALRRAVVSTSLGAEGLNLVHGDSILIADDARAFADRVVDVLGDAGLAARLGRRGRRHARDHFDWRRIGERTSDLFARRLGLVARGLHAGAPAAERAAS